jgi:hypothetical protein
VQINRLGDTCPAGATYDAIIGECVAPACPLGEARNAENVCVPIVCPVVNESVESVYSPKQSKCVLYPNLDNEEACGFLKGKTSGSTVITVSSNSAEGPKGVTSVPNYCGVTVTKAECTSKINPSPESLSQGSYNCKVSGIYTGDYIPGNTTTPDGFCPNGTCTEPPPPKPEPPAPIPANFTDTKPCVYSAAPGGSTCTSSTVKSKEGTVNCGTVNGAYTCIAKSPSHNGLDIRTDIVTTPDANGGTKTVKTDTATSTDCTNIGSCKVSKTQNVTTITKDGQGNTTSTTGSCTGEKCPDKNGNPDGDGDGFGDCVGDECGTDEGGDDAGIEKPELEEQDTYTETTQKFYDRVKSSPLIGGLGSIQMPTGGSCNIGSAQTFMGSIDLNSFCTIAPTILDPLRYLFLAIWAWAAIRLFFTA